ncbi:DUF1404 domain-containing protein [Sulfurisphaera ohwakuensis]|uniref:DUF1404 domain-containing protein n=1 Tax=Sulfurisphaera ohwakuensis TaxID=69656 RepID=A0A650CJI6_SULOH|nr:DUF1404 domain-containing protein [Sulfurisphaera ohwakuensis]MBB5254634.1 hypothetical protein [Sulfurisphaera ohwakuensis]QGR18024.1 DUF1404 domain-containing protein [Sulfurisphaera ohwakuensis]
MIKYSGMRNWKDLVVPTVFILAFVNPYVESLQYYNPLVYMLDHYALYAAGVLVGYKFFKGSIISFILGIIPAGFWHIPLFFALGAAFPLYRGLSEATLFLGGILAGSYIPKMSLTFKIGALGIYMFADSLLSIFFVLGYPQYSNVDFKFLAWGNGILPFVGVEMFIVMNIVLVYSLYKLLKNISLF